MDQHLWMIGGQSPSTQDEPDYWHANTALDTVWCFDVKQNIWFKMPPLPKAVGVAVACVCYPHRTADW